MSADAIANLFICQPGYESLMYMELCSHNIRPLESGRGWVLAENAAQGDFCFAHLRLFNTETFNAASINTQVAQLMGYFMERIRGVALPDGWPLIFRFADGITGLGQRIRTVEKEFRTHLRKRMARLDRMADCELPRGGGNASGLFVFFSNFDCFHVAIEAWSGGQCRMADDPAAPSRSYLKTEEAFVVMGREPVTGERVVDLGAAPGGWSYSAAKRGASVVAVDNGPLKGGAKGHPLIQHRREDAFKSMPSAGETFDWLLCDLVEEPHRVIRLIEQWLKGGHCRNFVVNLKFGRANALKLLEEVLDSFGQIRPHCTTLRVRHLFHDRDEFTLMGHVSPLAIAR